MILAYGKQEATASLYLDGLPAAARARLHRLAPGSLARDAAALAAAEAVIVLREFRPLLRPGLLDGLRRRGTPLAWFCDDDLVALGQAEPAFAYYTARRVRGFARDCAACIASTPA